MRVYKINWGRLLIVRWLIVSWIFQAIHVLDKTEKLFRITSEVFLLLVIFIILYLFNSCILSYYISLFLVHSLFYFFNSTWLVGYREIDRDYHGRDINNIISFLTLIKKDADKAELCKAVLVYGSLCRKMYHNRSDLDLRIIFAPKNRLKLLLKAIKYRTLATFKYKIPLDLKIVDSEVYLKKEMRKEELPIEVFISPSFLIQTAVIKFEELVKNPTSFCK